MAASGLLIAFYRDRGLIGEPRRPMRRLTRHDTKIAARAKFYDEAGVALTLTGLTVRYSLRDCLTGTVIVNRQTATQEDQGTNPGEAFWTFTGSQVTAALLGVEEWEVTHAAGVIETFPVGSARQFVRISEDVDAT